MLLAEAKELPSRIVFFETVNGCETVVEDHVKLW